MSDSKQTNSVEKLLAQATRHFQSGQHQDALSLCIQAESLSPKNIDICKKKLACAHAMGSKSEMLDYSLQLSELTPKDSRLWKTIAFVSQELKRYPEAALAFKQYQALTKPTMPLLIMQASNLIKAKAYQEAIDVYKKAEKLFPNEFAPTYLRIFHSRQLCDWSTWDADIQALREAIPDPAKNFHINPYVAITYPEFTPGEIFKIAQIYGKKYIETITTPPLKSALDLKPGKKIKLGILSADWLTHATTHLIIEVLEKRNIKDFETTLYSYKAEPTEDAATQRCRKAAEYYIDISDLSDLNAAKLIESQGIDMLIDLKGFTAESRLGIQAHRPAPILLSWLGYPGSLGEPRLADYIIGDPVVSPLDHQTQYSETILNLPLCYQPNKRWQPVPQPMSRQQAGLPEDAFVFCSFNQAYKLTPHMFALWCRLVSQVPGSVLWLLQPKSDEAQAYISSEFEKTGLSPERLIFAPRLPLNTHEKRIACADLGLDTFPYTSHTTGRDLLWSGVPYVAMCGDTFASRVSSSLLIALGLKELVVHTDEEWFNLNLKLAGDRKRLKALRHRLLDTNPTSELFNPQKFSNDLYATLGGLASRSVYQRRHQADFAAHTVYEDEHLRAVIQRAPGDVQLVFFGDFTQSAQEPKLPLNNLCEQQNITLIAILPKIPTWFPPGSVQKALNAVDIAIQSKGRRMVYGASMGGYAAIKYSKILDAELVLALYPQFSIHADQLGMATGYDQYATSHEFNLTNKSQHPINANEVSGKLILTCDPVMLTDMAHIQRIIQVTSDVQFVPLPFTGRHQVALLKQSALLPTMLNKFSEGQIKVIPAILRRIRLHSQFGVELALKMVYMTKPKLFSRYMSKLMVQNLLGCPKAVQRAQEDQTAVDKVFTDRFNTLYMPLLDMALKSKNKKSLQHLKTIEDQFVQTGSDMLRLRLAQGNSGLKTPSIQTTSGAGLYYDPIQGKLVSRKEDLQAWYYPLQFKTKGSKLEFYFETIDQEAYHLNIDNTGRIHCSKTAITAWTKISKVLRGKVETFVLSGVNEVPFMFDESGTSSPKGTQVIRWQMA